MDDWVDDVDVSDDDVMDVSDTWIQSNLWAKSPFRAMISGPLSIACTLLI